MELGAGTGVFTAEGAKRVGLEGQLIAVDIQPEMIAQVERRVRQARLGNVETHTADAYDLPLPDASVDRVFLISALSEIPDPDRALAEISRVL